MSFVNFKKKEVQLKIVYYGPGLSGKTTNLQVIHRMINPAGRGDLTSVATSGERTLFFDFMPLVAQAFEGYQTRFQLYTVPGQVMYNLTRRLVLRGVDGVVFVADSQWSQMPENAASLANLEDNLTLQRERLGDIPCVLQYNKRDVPDATPRHYLEYLLNNRDVQLPTFDAVASKGEGVFESLNMIARLVLHRFLAVHKSKEDGVRELVLV